mgnify:CR=1 FL=1
MSNYSVLWQAIWPDLCSFYDSSHYDFMNNKTTSNALKARLHAYQLFLIELVADKYRRNHSSPMNQLEGISALHHMVFSKTNMKPSDIKSLGLNDLVFVLLDDIVPDHLPAEAQSYLKTLLSTEWLPKIDFESYAGWEIGSGSRFLKIE